MHFVFVLLQGLGLTLMTYVIHTCFLPIYSYFTFVFYPFCLPQNKLILHRSCPFLFTEPSKEIALHIHPHNHNITLSLSNLSSDVDCRLCMCTNGIRSVPDDCRNHLHILLSAKDPS
jgi:hypothetical protein